MTNHISETGQCAFTWTGPYGSGKSSLAVILAALLNGSQSIRNQAEDILGQNLSDSILSLLPLKTKGWRILPVVGRRENPVQVIGESIQSAGMLKAEYEGKWKESQVIETINRIVKEKPKAYGGLIVFVDEMGKLLEGIARNDGDIYIFQQLAEIASRSNNRLIFIGVLHQAFEEYSGRLSQTMRDEWSKIQGRFVDLSLNTAGEEVVELISRAIETDHNHQKLSTESKVTSAQIRERRPMVSDGMSHTLEACWPLHPIVASLIGPISRSRFGQNQRSVFGFLNSAEPQGFQDYLHSNGNNLYTPDRLLDYLRLNLEPSILASPDGHRWALAAEAIDNCTARSNSDLHSKLLKTIAIIDLFKERSGLIPNVKTLNVSLPGYKKSEIAEALSQIQKWSLIIFRKFNDSYAIHSGSDFDIEKALKSALNDVDDFSLSDLRSIAGIQPVLAKRHYHDTGSIRLFTVEITRLSKLNNVINDFEPSESVMGQLILTVPMSNESEQTAREICQQAVDQSQDWDIIVGLSNRSWNLPMMAKELIALHKVQKENPILLGDPIARRELDALVSERLMQIESEISRVFETGHWFRTNKPSKKLTYNKLNKLVSGLADQRFSKSPKLHNELLNRDKPSGSAVSGQNALMRSMVTNEGKSRLGIKGFPAEGGLFKSILESTNLYCETQDGFRFQRPGQSDKDTCNLQPLWEAADSFLQHNKNKTVVVSEIYDVWRKQPYGVKNGLMPIMMVAYMLSMKHQLAFYTQGVFKANLSDVDVEYLVKDSSYVQLRWMNLSEMTRTLLAGMASIVRDLDPKNELRQLQPIDVGRGLISIFDNLHPWTHRTMQLSKNAKQIRLLFKKAKDPNKFLFDDIPTIAGKQIDIEQKDHIQFVIDTINEGLTELSESFSTMLYRTRDLMLSELQVPNTSPQALDDLRGRAENVQQLGGDFRLDAFINRLLVFQGSIPDIEGLISLAASKPPHDWIDSDLDRAAIDLTEMSQNFLRIESFARVKGREDKRHAMAVIVPVNGRPAPVLKNFSISDNEKPQVNKILKKFESVISNEKFIKQDVILAAIAELCAKQVQDDE